MVDVYFELQLEQAATLAHNMNKNEATGTNPATAVWQPGTASGYRPTKLLFTLLFLPPARTAIFSTGVALFFEVCDELTKSDAG